MNIEEPDVEPKSDFPFDAINYEDLLSLRIQARSRYPAIRPSLLFTAEEVAGVNWDAVFEKW